MSSDYERDLIRKLKSSSTSDVDYALIKIRKNYSKDVCKMKKLQNHSAIKLILSYLEHPKFSNISLSIIANICINANFTFEVIKYGGLKSLIRIMKSCVNDEIQNRACRALGNIAKFEMGLKAISVLNPASTVIHFLSETEDEQCQQTAIRTLAILGKCPKVLDLISDVNVINHITKFLHSTNKEFIIGSIKALSNLTSHSSIYFANQLYKLQIFEVLIQLYSHSDELIRNYALISLNNLSTLEIIRSNLIKVGAIQLFISILSKSESHATTELAIKALCNCLDHIHMWNSNGISGHAGLKPLLLILENNEYQDIHLHVVKSMLPLSYEARVTDILLDLRVIDILIHILKQYIEKNKCYSAEYAFKCYCKDLNDVFCEKDIELENEHFCSDVVCNKEYSFDVSHSNKLTSDISNNKEFSNIKIDSLEKFDSMSDFQSEYSRAYVKKCFSLGSYNSVTSDYSSLCSIDKMSSSLSPKSLSPDIYYERDLSSPSTSAVSFTDMGSPISIVNDCSDQHLNWSPVISVHSNSESQFDFKISNTEKLPDNIDASEDLSISSVNASVFSVECSEVQDTSSGNYSFGQKYELTTNESDKCDEFSSIDIKFTNLSNKRKTVEKSKSIHKLNENISHCKEESPNKKIKNQNNEDLANNQTSNYKSFVGKCSSTELHPIDHHLLLFIRQLSFHMEKKTNSEIASKNCFSTLIDYLCFIHNPSLKVETVLINLLRNRYCFEKLVMSEFVSEMEEKVMAVCDSCSHSEFVTSVYKCLIKVGTEEAESDYGIGTLCHVLLTADKIGQFNALCTISKFVSSQNALSKLLYQSNGLSLLFEFVLDKDPLICMKSVIVLCELYQSLKKSTITEKCCFSNMCSVKTTSKCSYKEAVLNVTFSVGRGTKILANREEVCKNSEYFDALLEGHFVERNSKYVILQDICAENLTTIFHFLHGCGSKNICPYLKRIPFSVLLDLLSDCDRFLLTDLKTFVEDKLCHCLLSTTAANIYLAAKNSNSPALSNKALHYFLSMDFRNKISLWKCFQQFKISSKNIDALKDIKILFENSLNK